MAWERRSFAVLQRAGPRLWTLPAPHVKRIHEAVFAAAQEGIPSIIVGERTHPEVEGILGWSEGKGVAVATISEADALP